MRISPTVSRYAWTMQLVTASETAHLISAISVAVGLAWAQKAATIARAIPSLTDSDGIVHRISFLISLFFLISFFSFLCIFLFLLRLRLVRGFALRILNADQPIHSRQLENAHNGRGRIDHRQLTA